MIFSPPEEGIPVIRKRRSPRIMFANSVLSNNTHNTPISIDTSNNIREGEASPTDSEVSSDEYDFMRDVASNKGSAESTPVDKFTPNNKFDNDNGNDKKSSPYQVSPSNVFCVTPAKAYVDTSSIGIATPMVQSNSTASIDINIDFNYLYENFLPLIMITSFVLLLLLKGRMEYNAFVENDITTETPSSSNSSGSGSGNALKMFTSFHLNSASNSIQVATTTATAMAVVTSTIVEQTLKSALTVLFTTISSMVKNINTFTISFGERATNLWRKVKIGTNQAASASSLVLTSATATTSTAVSNSAKNIASFTTSTSKKLGSQFGKTMNSITTTTSSTVSKFKNIKL